jgi:hypothetical protein
MELGTKSTCLLFFLLSWIGIDAYNQVIRDNFILPDLNQSDMRFLLLSLSMDKFYCRNRLAFEMMDSLGIFNLFYSISERKINGTSEGVFMFVDDPRTGL